MSITVIVIAYVHNVVIGFRKWGSLLIDSGKEWDLCAKLARGEPLYVPGRYYYGPLPAYVNGFLFRIFGADTDVAMCAGFAGTAAMCVILYRTSRLFTGRAVATIVTVSFLYICAFAQVWPNGICNFIQPYSIAAPYGILMASASIYFLIRHQRKLRRVDLMLAVAFLALSALCKVELFFATSVTHFVFLVGCVWIGTKQLRFYAITYGIGIVLVAGVYWRIAAQVGTDVLLDNLFGVLHTPAYQQWSRDMSGWSNLQGSLKNIALSGLTFAGLAGAVLALGLAAEKFPGLNVFPRLFAAGFAIAGTAYYFLPMYLAFRAMPVLLAVCILVLIAKWFRSREHRAQILPHALLFTFAFVCLFRFALNINSYGLCFFLIPPSLIALAAFWSTQLPGWTRFAEKMKQGGAGAVCGLLLALSIIHCRISSRAFAARTDYVESRRGRLYVTGKVEQALVDWLSNVPLGQRVLMVPQGVGYAFIAGFDTPYHLHTYMATDFRPSYPEESALHEWMEVYPDWIVRTPVNTNDAISGGFGVSHGLLLSQWINQNYVPYAKIGPDNLIVIFRRSHHEP